MVICKRCEKKVIEVLDGSCISCWKQNSDYWQWSAETIGYDSSVVEHELKQRIKELETVQMKCEIY